MRAYGGVDVYIHVFLTSALAGGEWPASRPGRFIPNIHWIGGWVDPRAGLDDLEKWQFLTLPGLELQPLGRPSRSWSLYPLRYPGSSSNNSLVKLKPLNYVLTNSKKPVTGKHWKEKTVLDTSNAAEYKNSLTTEQVLKYKMKPKVSGSNNNSIKFLYLSA
jgi:hypothetical protein